MKPMRLLPALALPPCLILVAAALVGAAAAPRATVGDLGSPECISFTGTSSFSPRVLRKAVGAAPEFLLAAHPSAPREELVETVRRAVERGYRNEGFPDVRVAVTPAADGRTLRAEVREGPRVRRGEIRVEGTDAATAAGLIRDLTVPPATLAAENTLAQSIDSVLAARRDSAAPAPGATTEAGALAPLNAAAAQLNAMLQQPAETAVVWRRGDPMPFRAGFEQEISTRAQRFFAARSHAQAAVKAVLQRSRDGREVDLLLHVDEGPRSTIGRVEVQGARTHRTEDIRELTGLQPGGPANPEAFAHAKLALWNSARFYTFDIATAPRAGAPGTVDITIIVSEIKDRPPVREPLPATEVALVRFANWLTTEGRRRDLAVGLQHEGVALDLALSPQRGLALLVNDGADAQFGLEIGAGHAATHVVAGGKGARREFAGLSQTWVVTLSFLTDEPTGADRDGTALNAGIAWQSLPSDPNRGPVQLSLTMSPAFACIALPKEASLELNGGELVLRQRETGRLLARIREDTGELLEWKVGPPPGSGRGEASVRSDPAAYAALAQRITAARRALPGEAGQASVLAPLLGHPRVRSFLADAADSPAGGMPLARWATAARLLERLLASPELATWWSGSPEAERDPEFTIPPDPALRQPTSPVAVLFGAAYYQLSTMLWPADSWPAKTARELFYVLSGQTKYTDAVVEALYRDERMGPMGSVIVAQLLRPTNPRIAWRFGHRALEKPRAEDFRRDWSLLLADESKLAGVVRDLIRGLATIPDEEIEAMLAGLPAPDIATARRALAELRHNPQRPLAELLQPLLDDWWNREVAPRLTERVHAWLTATTPDPAIAALAVNGETVHRKFLRLALPGGPLHDALPARPAGGDGPSAAYARDLLTDLALLAQDFAAGGNAVRGDFLDQQLNALIRAKAGGDRARFESDLARAGLSVADQREIIRLQQIVRETINRLGAALPRPTAAEVQQAIAALPPAADHRTLRVITVPKTERPLAEAIRTEALNDGTFDRVWDKYSGRTGNQPRRFLLRRVTRPDLADARLAAAAFALAEASTSEVVESGDLLYVVHRLKTDPSATLGERQKEATQLAATRKLEAALISHLALLRSQAVVVELPDPASTITHSAPRPGGQRFEFEDLKVVRAAKTRVAPLNPVNAGGAERLSAGRAVECTSAPDGWAEWSFTLPAEGVYRLELLGIRAPQHARIRTSVDGRDLGAAIELHAAATQPSGPLHLGELRLAAGDHRLRVSVVDRHASALAYHFGLDALDVIPADEAAVRRFAGTPALAPDFVEITRISPDRATVGGRQTYTVRVKYSLASSERGVVALGFNAANAKSYQLLARKSVERGQGEAELSAAVLPRDWGDGNRFRVYANLSADPHPKQWTPLATTMKSIPLSGTAAPASKR